MNKHKLSMVLCCLIPLTILAVLWMTGVPGGYLVLGVMLLCPLLHFVMMRGMPGEGGDGGGHTH